MNAQCAYRDIVLEEARKHDGLGIELEEIVAVGNLAMVEALKSHDPTKGSAPAWIARKVRWAIAEAIGARHTVQVPRHHFPYLAGRKEATPGMAEAVERSRRHLETVPLDGHDTPDGRDDLVRIDIRDEVDVYLSWLPADERAAMTSVFLQGHTHAQAAAKLGTTPGVIRHRIDAAKDRIRRRAGAGT